MTGTPVRERVPDWLVRKANQIELIDSSPEQLRRRMLHGNIYPRDRPCGRPSRVAEPEHEPAEDQSSRRP
jgi:hypothetical protein